MKSEKRYGNQSPTFARLPSDSYSRERGQAIARLFSHRGVKLYPSQVMELEIMAAKDEDGFFEFPTVSISKPRQNGKSYAARFYALAMAMKGMAVLFTAHYGPTTRKMFTFLRDWCKRRKDVQARIDRVINGKGSEGIYFKSGGMIEFMTRTTSGGRGATYDIIFVDEAQELTYEQLDAIKPTTIASGAADPQTIYLGTPPGPKSPGEVFRDQHDAAHAATTGAVWLEWSVAQVPDMTDDDKLIDLAYETNPAMGYRIREKIMRDVFDSYRKRPDSFAREYLGWWSPIVAAKSAIDRDDWRACLTEQCPRDERIAYGVKFSQDGFVCAIAAAWMDAESLPHVEIAAYRTVPAVGIDSIAEYIYERRKRSCLTVIDGMACADDMDARLKALKMPEKGYRIATTADYTAACSMLLNAVREHGVTHADQLEMNDAVADVRKRPIGHRGAFGFDGGGALTVDAAALALWGLRTSNRDPKKKVRVFTDG